MVAKDMPNNARWYVCDFCSERSPQHTFIPDRHVNGEAREWDICNHCMDQLSEFIDIERAKLLQNQSGWFSFIASLGKANGQPPLP